MRGLQVHAGQPAGRGHLDGDKPVVLLIAVAVSEGLSGVCNYVEMYVCVCVYVSMCL